MNRTDNQQHQHKSGGKPIILVIDDDPTHRKLMQLIANHIDIDPHVFADCDEALEAMKLLSFDLILMDWRMAGIDGCACTNKIRALEKQAGKHVPIVAVTAGVMPGDREICLEAGMDDYLSKPFTVEEIRAIIAKWVPARKETAPTEEELESSGR